MPVWLGVSLGFILVPSPLPHAGLQETHSLFLARLCDQGPKSKVSFTHHCLRVWSSFLVTIVYKISLIAQTSGVTFFVELHPWPWRE